MINNIGAYLLIAAILLNSLNLLITATTPLRAKINFASAQVASICSYFILAYLFIAKDFSNLAVMLNSSSQTPFFYRIAGSWASHETSLLFWLAANSAAGLIAFGFALSQEKNLNYFVKIFSSIQLCWATIIYFSANPFIASSHQIAEGYGMNPVLQDQALMIHPPILFLSYSCYFICFCSSLSTLFTGQYYRFTQNCSRLGWMLLTAGVGFGGWWAYRELGWGGYWFFDPVENISLLVWLLATAYHHSLLQKNMPLMKLSLGLLPFLCIIIGTFLVRSGLLVSVHSFTSSKSSFLLLTLACLLTIISFIVLLSKFKNFFSSQRLYRTNKYIMMQGGNYLWLTGSIIILFSLITPIIANFYGKTINIEAKFFTDSLIPIMLTASCLAGLIYFNKAISKLVIILAIASFFTSFTIFFPYISVIIYFAVFVSITIIVGTLWRAIEKYNQPDAFNPSVVSMLVSHFAVGIFIIAVVANIVAGKDYNLTLAIGQKESIGKNSVQLLEMKYSEGPNYFRQIAYLKITDTKENKIVTLKPELRYYPIEKSLTSDTDIYSFVTADWYAVINTADDKQVNCQIYWRPAISFIWLSLLLMCFGISIRLI